MKVFWWGFFAWVVACVLGVLFGSVSELEWAYVFQLRVPRVLLATAIGLGLAVSGAVLQALFSNPLCEPYTLGVASGAALGAVLGASLGLEFDWVGLAGPALVGALTFMLILQWFSSRVYRPGVSGMYVVLLCGVMLWALGSSLVSLWLAVSDITGIQGALFWLLGDLSRARLEGALFACAGVLILSLFVWRGSQNLDVLLLGEENAAIRGVDVVAVRKKFIFLSSLIVGLCVSSAGMIGFIGLIVPHFARLFVGSLHGRLIPVCMVWGATALVVSDTLSRVAVRPYEIPVGVVTAIIGAPLFVFALFQTARGSK